MFETTKQMTYEQWIEARRHGIGGSDVAAVLGLSKYKTPLDVYNDKLNLSEPIQDNPRMKAGRMLENTIAEWFADETGITVRKDNKIRIHKEHDFLIANIDRLLISKEKDGPGILECKNTNSYAVKFRETDIDLEHYCQVQHYLFVTGYQWAYIAYLIDGWDFKYYEVYPDPDFQRYMLEKETEFWTNNVTAKVQPEPINLNDLNKLYPNSSGEYLEAGELAIKTILELKNEKALVKAHADRAEKLEFQLKEVLKDAEGFKDSSGEILCTFKANKESLTFDAKKFQESNPDLYNRFLKTKTNNRILRIK